MTNKELEALQSDIGELRKAVRKANPFLRSVVEIRSYALLALPLGFLILAYCLFSHFLILEFGSAENLPPWWSTLSWSALAFFLVACAVAKWLIISRRAAQIEEGATFLTAIKAMYGGGWVNLNLPLALCILVMIPFLIWIGHSWYLVPALAIFLGLSASSVAQTVEAREYLATGWYALVTGLLSLFFIEASPFLWTAVVWAGVFLVFGFTGFIGKRGR